MSTLILTPGPDTVPTGEKLISVPALAAAAQIATGLRKGHGTRSQRRRFSATRALRGTDDASFRPFRIY